jgi:hypothetical protein
MENKNIRLCIAYILETEYENYIDYCEENDLNPEELHINHIYAIAYLANKELAHESN